MAMSIEHNDEIIKPEKRARNDGMCEYCRSDDGEFLIMRGDYTAQQIVQAAVDQHQIDNTHAAEFKKYGTYYQSWYKVSGICRDGFSSWHYPRNNPCRGAYFASCIQLP